METRREALIDDDAEILWRLLRKYDAHERIFALSEIAQMVQRRLKSRESSRYHIDFTRDEAPTRPDTPIPELGDRETRRVDIAAISAEIEKSRKK